MRKAGRITFSAHVPVVQGVGVALRRQHMRHAFDRRVRVRVLRTQHARPPYTHATDKECKHVE